MKRFYRLANNQEAGKITEVPLKNKGNPIGDQIFGKFFSFWMVSITLNANNFAYCREFLSKYTQISSNSSAACKDHLISTI